MVKTMKKIDKLFNSKHFIIIAGLFLIPSLIEHLPFINQYIGIKFPVVNIFGLMFELDTAWVTIIISGVPLAWLAISRIIFERFISSALLITMAMVAAICINEIFAAGEVAWIMAIGAFLEEKTVHRAKKGIEKLLSLAPMQGRRVTRSPNGEEVEEMVMVENLFIGDIVRVLPGEAIPSDGVLENGSTSVDQSIMTGESLPVDKTAGDEAFAGTINLFGTADVKVTKSMENSALQKMVQLVREAENNKAPIQKIADKVAVWLVPIAFFIALATFLISGEITRGVTMLIVFCPCALALATPVSIVAAIGQATKHGVLIKSGEALEKMGKVNAIAFDKTGTLTYGKLSITDVTPADDSGLSADDVLALAASVESRSEHPLGKAILAGAKEKGLELTDISDFVMTVGKGVTAFVNGVPVYCGNLKFLQENDVAAISETELDRIGRLQSQGKAVIAIARNNEYIGLVSLSDVYRQDAPSMIRNLTAAGIERTILLTGDNQRTAEYIASQIGLTDIKAELLPVNKVDSIKEIQIEGYNVCMVGDGVNDAPALKTANVGVAMGSIGSDIAIEAADIALMGDDIYKVPYIKALSNAAVASIKLNILLSLIINAVALYFSAVGVIGPVLGALVHNAGSVLVVLNAALLYDRKIYKDDRL